VVVFGNVLDVEEIVLDTSAADEGTLARGDQFVHIWLQPCGEDFGDQLGKRMYQTNRPVV
jgi:hypothetical protein